MSEARKRSRFRFSLKLLLIFMTLVAVYLVGRWNGYQEGKRAADKRAVVDSRDVLSDILMYTVRNEREGK